MLKTNNKDTITTSLSGASIAHFKHNPHLASVPLPSNLNTQFP